MIATVWFISKMIVDNVGESRFESHFWNVAFDPHNIKWILVGFIILSVSLFCLVFSSLSHHQSEQALKKMQLLSSAAFSLGHGGNDSQKVMGIIAAAIIVYSNTEGVNFMEMPTWLQVSLPSGDVPGIMPEWIPLACYSAIAVGTLSGG